MLKYFQCPNGDKVEVKECLRECPARCMTLPSLKKCAEVREWAGIPSITQLINGPRYNKLMITTDYTENPRKQGFRLLGSVVSEPLENASRLEAWGICGTPDYLDLSEGDLIDYKTAGSYKCKLALGLDKVKIDDPSGAVYLKSGKWGKAGSPKQVDFWSVMNEPKMEDYIAQLNGYRVLIKECLKIEVRTMKIQAIIRDGGTINAQQNGFEKDGDNIILIDIPYIPDEEILDYFLTRKDELLKVMEEEGPGRCCNAEESWDGVRCHRFCPVADECKKHYDCQWLL